MDMKQKNNKTKRAKTICLKTILSIIIIAIMYFGIAPNVINKNVFMDNYDELVEVAKNAEAPEGGWSFDSEGGIYGDKAVEASEKMRKGVEKIDRQNNIVSFILGAVTTALVAIIVLYRPKSKK